MAAILKDFKECRVFEGDNDISSVRAIDVRIRPNEIVAATIEIFPEQIHIEAERLYTVINDVRYQLVRVDKEGDAECTQDS